MLLSSLLSHNICDICSLPLHTYTMCDICSFPLDSLYHMWYMLIPSSFPIAYVIYVPSLYNICEVSIIYLVSAKSGTWKKKVAHGKLLKYRMLKTLTGQGHRRKWALVLGIKWCQAKTQQYLCTYNILYSFMEEKREINEEVAPFCLESTFMTWCG